MCTHAYKPSSNCIYASAYKSDSLTGAAIVTVSREDSVKLGVNQLDLHMYMYVWVRIARTLSCVCHCRTEGHHSKEWPSVQVCVCVRSFCFPAAYSVFQGRKGITWKSGLPSRCVCVMSNLFWDKSTVCMYIYRIPYLLEYKSHLSMSRTLKWA